jgi:glycerol-3-phosphate O-acyltransferase
MRGIPGVEGISREKIKCGPEYVYFDEPIPVTKFLLDFEDEWDRAWLEIKEPSKRNKAYVVEWLERAIHKASKERDTIISR